MKKKIILQGLLLPIFGCSADDSASVSIERKLLERIDTEKGYVGTATDVRIYEIGPDVVLIENRGELAFDTGPTVGGASSAHTSSPMNTKTHPATNNPVPPIPARPTINTASSC